VAIDVARMDRSGRVRVASLLRVLGWLPGSGIDLDFAAGAIVVSAAPGGRHTIGAHGEIRLPASVRASRSVPRRDRDPRRRPHSSAACISSVPTPRRSMPSATTSSPTYASVSPVKCWR
jgi:hypothetical protein